MPEAGSQRRRTQSRRIAALILCLSLVLGAISAPIRAEAQASGDLPGWRAALASGSDRLALFTFGRLGPDVPRAAIAELSARTGGAHRAGEGFQIIARRVSAQPILSYSRNFNGGLANENITLGGIDFAVDPADRAKSGVVVGASVLGGVIGSYAGGSILRVSGLVRTEALPAEDLRRNRLALSVCAEHFVGGWTWLDACGGVGVLDRNYGDTLRQQNASVGLTQIAHMGGLDQQVGASLTLTDQGYGRQQGILARWLAAVPSVGAVGIDAHANRRFDGELTRLRQINLSLARPLFDRDVVFEFEAARDGGISFFGDKRTDDTLILSVEAAVTDKFSVEAAIGRRNSSIDLYDESLFSLNVELTDW
ncbi:hypothetical protein MLD63_14745 [Paracoccus sp. TK19116]|uniref:Autotransporter outer membrane beta-barrel domain-containing protein n=1 Tax=Paracoccus albicereus TaxID=2922394 RepID=A0ABT1MU73_9RHOB|nr:hypothetical protein [Paracoccus albicereus]MCQ0971679.1 hypothetical protein [Paracoccus albicereus]